MRKITTILWAWIVFFSPEIKAQPMFNYDPYRPSVATRSKKLTINIRLNIGSTDFREYGKIKTAVDKFLSFDGGDNPQETINGLGEWINSFQNFSLNPNIFTMPMLFINFNTKYFEWHSAAGAMSYNTVKMQGLKNPLLPSQINPNPLDPSINLGSPHNLLTATSHTYFGGEAMAIGKIPVWLFKILLGAGSTVAYDFTFQHKVILPETIKSFDDIEQDSSTNGQLYWSINALAGLEFNHPWFNPRIVLIARQIYGNLSGVEAAQFDLGISSKMWLIGTLSLDLINLKDPTIKAEFSRYFYGNNEIAIGGVFHNKFGTETLGYASLFLGGHFVKFEMTCLFSKTALGGILGLRLGWEP